MNPHDDQNAKTPAPTAKTSVLYPTDLSRLSRASRTDSSSSTIEIMGLEDSLTVVLVTSDDVITPLNKVTPIETDRLLYFGLGILYFGIGIRKLGAWIRRKLHFYARIQVSRAISSHSCQRCNPQITQIILGQSWFVLLSRKENRCNQRNQWMIVLPRSSKSCGSIGSVN